MKLETKSKRSKAHQRYMWEGKRVPGVTTITGLRAKFLTKWANDLGLNGISVTDYVDELAEIGTVAHYLVECYLKKEVPELREHSPDVVDRAETCAMKYYDWEKRHTFEPILIEEQLVWERYGGTIDMYGKLDGKLTLIDLKTSKALYNEHKFQVSAYATLLEQHGHEVEEIHILRIGRNANEGFEDHKVENVDAHWACFEDLLNLYYHEKALR